MSVLLALCLSLPALAGELAGVTMPDTATVGGQELVLNGMGLREKYFIDVYVGGLYLPSRVKTPSEAIQPDVPKRLVMHFVYSEVDKAKLTGAFDEGLEKQADAAANRAAFDTLNGWMETVHSGDVIELEYVPGKGTKVTVKGQEKGTIEGVGFMRALWTVYLGDHPPTEKLKRGMMGG